MKYDISFNHSLRHIAFSLCCVLLLSACVVEQEPAMPLVLESSAPYNHTPIDTNTVAFYKNVAYETIDGKIPSENNLTNELSFDFYKPKTDDTSPLVIYLHGGAFLFEDKVNIIFSDRFKDQSLRNKNVIQYLTQKGIAFASVNYRLIPIGQPEADNATSILQSLEDMQRAIRFIKYHHQGLGIDPERIIVIGHSAGASGALFADIKAKQINNYDPDPIQQVSTQVRAISVSNPQVSLDIVPLIAQHFTLEACQLARGFIEINSALCTFTLQFLPRYLIAFFIDNVPEFKPALQFYGLQNGAQIFSRQASELRKNLDTFNLLSKSSTEIRMINLANEVTDFSIADSPRHVELLYQQSLKHNLNIKAYAPGVGIDDDDFEGFEDFISRVLIN